MYAKFVIEANQGQIWRNPNNAHPKSLEFYFSGLEPPFALLRIIDIPLEKKGVQF